MQLSRNEYMVDVIRYPNHQTSFVFVCSFTKDYVFMRTGLDIWSEDIS